MKSLLSVLLLIVCAVASVSLADVEDTALGAMLNNNWQALLPEDLANTRTQLIKILTPANTTSPQHLGSMTHARLARDGGVTHASIKQRQ